MSLLDLKKKIEKASKGIHVSILSESDIAHVSEWIPTPSYDLNRVLTGNLFKGLPEKSLTYLVGVEASFKSSFSCLCAANAQKQGYTPIVIDSEGAWTGDFVKRWGLDPDNMLYIYEPFVDNVCATIAQLIDSDDEKFIIILDSLGGLENEKLLTDATSGDVKADQGGLQKRIKRLLKLMLNLIKKKKSIGIYTGHMYGNPGASYGPTESIGGGKFAALAPDTIIQLKKSKNIDKDKNVIGNLVTATTLKNRFYPAFNQCIIDINYTDGIQRKAGMVELAIKAGYIDKAGAGWMTNTITNEKVQGELKAEAWINDDMLNKLNEFLEDTGYSTINEELKEELVDAETGEVKL